MVQKFDPIYWNGTIFEFEEWDMSGDDSEYVLENKPIPAAYFPKTLTVIDASQELPDIFHTYRDTIVFSERARLTAEEWAPGEIEFIPVMLKATRSLIPRLQLASAYYFINVLGRAQRLLWLEMAVKEHRPDKEGMINCTLDHDFGQWKLRERAGGEPLIWHDRPLLLGNKWYRRQTEIFVEDILWHELDANFPDQLNDMPVGSGL